MIRHAERVGAGPPVVLLHGFSSTSRVWREVTPLLPPHMQLIAVDLPGHGRVAAPAALATIGGFVADAWETLHSGRVEQPRVLAGHSLGGAVAIGMAFARPGDVRALVLMAPMEPGHGCNRPRVVFAEQCISFAKRWGVAALADWLDARERTSDGAVREE